MSDEEPTRLKETGETPEHLVRALQALGRDRDGDRLARVAERLASGGAGGAGGLGAGLKVIGAGVIVVGVVALGMVMSTGRKPSTSTSATTSATTTTTTSASASATTSTSARANTTASASTTTSAGGARKGISEGEGKPKAKGFRSKASFEAVARQGLEDTAQAEVAEPAEPIEEAVKTIEVVAAKPAKSVEPLKSEEALLLEARKLARDEPHAAMRLLEEHALRFATGLLVPEREVLAIETLRRLGRGEEAEARLVRFKARYPRSIHLRRLAAGRDE